MYNKSNLALVINETYDYKPNKIKVEKFDYNELSIPTKRALILRENIMASGMEVTDIVRISAIFKYNLLGGI